MTVCQWQKREVFRNNRATHDILGSVRAREKKWYFGVVDTGFLILHFSLGTQPEDGYPSTASSVTELSAARPATADVKTYRETPNTYSKLPVCSYLCIYCIHLTVSSDAFSWFGCVFFVFPFVLLHGTGHKRDCVQGLRGKKGMSMNF